jgi:hypothetical protein
MARTKPTTADLATIQMALVGYELEKQKIENKIRELQAALKGRKVALPSAALEEKESPAPKRVLSPAARRRIAKKRWAEHRKRAAAAAKEKG